MSVYFGDIYGISGQKAEVRQALRGIAREAVKQNEAGAKLPVAFFCKSAVVGFESQEPLAEDWLVFTGDDFDRFVPASGALRKFDEEAGAHLPGFRYLARRFIHALECRQKPDGGLTNAYFAMVGVQKDRFPTIPHLWTRLTESFPPIHDYMTAASVNAALAAKEFDPATGRMPDRFRETLPEEPAEARPQNQTGQLALSAFA